MGALQIPGLGPVTSDAYLQKRNDANVQRRAYQTLVENHKARYGEYYTGGGPICLTVKGIYGVNIFTNLVEIDIKRDTKFNNYQLEVASRVDRELTDLFADDCKQVGHLKRYQCKKDDIIPLLSAIFLIDSTWHAGQTITIP